MENINTNEIITILRFHWKKLCFIGFTSLGVALLFSSSLFIAPNYKSVAVVFPSNLVPYGAESNTEQLLQYLNSNELKTQVTKRFNLFAHYNIDSTTTKAQSKFDEIYKQNIKCTNTLFESAEIQVIDKSPIMAQKIANAIIEETNKLIEASKKTILQEYLFNFSQQLKSQQTEIDTIEERLRYLSSTYGLLDVKAQSKMLSKNSNKRSLTQEEQQLLKGIIDFGSEYTTLQSQLHIVLNSYKKTKLNYDKHLTDYNGHLSFTTVVSKANLPDDSYHPFRFLIVLSFCLSSLLLSGILILSFHKK